MPLKPDAITNDDGEPVLVDCRFMRCPLPVLRAQKVWAMLPVGASMRVLATDDNAGKDMATLAAHVGFSYEESRDGDVLVFVSTAKD